MGYKIDINFSESANAKKQCHSLPYSVLRIWNDQCKHFKCGFTPDSNPKMSKKRGNTIVIHLYIKVKITDIAYTLGFSEHGLTNASNLSLALPLTATQKGGIKRGNKSDIYLCEKTILKPVWYRTLGFPSTEWPMEAILGLHLPLTVLPKGIKGVTKVTFVYVKRVKAKTGVTSHLSVPRVRNTQCKQL